MISRVRVAHPHAMGAVLSAMLAGDDQVVVPATVANVVTDLDNLVPKDFAGVLVHTSGSTGRPKVVMLSREALLAAVDAVHERLGGPGDWVNPLPTANVAGLMTLVRCAAARTIHHQISSDLHDLLQPHGRTYLSLVPAQLYRCLSEGIVLSHYAAVLIGGGPLVPSLRLQAEDAGIHVVETYGMSETCGGVVYDGVPLAGVVPRIAEDGRIIISTPTAFSGYLGEPQSQQGTGSVRSVLTSDRGTWVDGILTVTGRVDDVVLIGGVNVDLAQLQAILDETFPHATACFAVPNDAWGATVAVVSTGPNPDEIRQALTGRVGSEAMPRRWVYVEVLPRTASGKIDRPAIMQLWEETHGKCE